MDIDRQWICERCGTHFDEDVNSCPTCSEKGVKPLLRLIHRLISADAVEEIIEDEIKKILTVIENRKPGGDKPSELELSEARFIECLNRIGADVHRLKFGQQPIYTKMKFD